jgi:predicted branched-subunit amino acid permease
VEETNRRAITGNALGIGVATGAYGISFGAVAIAAGLSLAQTCVLSLLMFTGASQFALVAVVGSGGSALAGAATAVLLGTRNAFYGLRLSRLLGRDGPGRLVAAHLVIDETTAMAVAQDTERAGRLGFWATGVAVFSLWNIGTLMGALFTQAVPDPKALGLDAAAPAAFLALLAPRMRALSPWLVALVAAGVAIVSVPFVPAGVPVLLAAAVAVVFGVRRSSKELE